MAGQWAVRHVDIRGNHRLARRARRISGAQLGRQYQCLTQVLPPQSKVASVTERVRQMPHDTYDLQISCF